jgi:hypothetical protein
MNPTIVIVVLSAMLVLSLHLDRRRRERDSRVEDNSVAAGFKKWLLGSHDALPPMTESASIPEVPKTVLRVSGNVPPESWSKLGAALLTNVPSDVPITAALDVSFAIDACKARAVATNLDELISELELPGLRVARVDPPIKRANRRVVIRLRNMSPRLQALLCVDR